MLNRLFISNIVLIDSVEIEFCNGLCILTGETGAGKSILMDALGFALGRPMRGKSVREGCDQGMVTAVFDISSLTSAQACLQEMSLDGKSEAIVRRVVNKDGRSKAYINDVPVSVQTLKAFAECVLEIHGQHDQHGLLNPATHLPMLDAFGRYDNELARVADTFSSYTNATQHYETLLANKEEAEREEDYVRYVIKELEGHDLTPEREQELDEKRRILMQQEKLAAILDDAQKSLSETVMTKQLLSCQNLLQRSGLDLPEVTNIIEGLNRAIIEIEEAEGSLQALVQFSQQKQDNLEDVEEELFTLRGLARKYQVQPDELQKFYNDNVKKLELLGDQSHAIDSAKEAVTECRIRYLEAAAVVTQKRTKAAKALEKAVMAELATLKMDKAKFHVEHCPLPEKQWQKTGVESIQFLISTNPGTPAGALKKVASGGELSRFMLAMKVVLSKVNMVGTMIFDEIDTGIGGAVADAVGARLKLLSEHVQVFAITHQPQVSARADLHLKVSKQVDKKTTQTQVQALSEQERIEEIARMLSGDSITSEARAAASRLMEASVMIPPYVVKDIVTV